jgi:UDP-N-acetylglucosamine:LPS N-acetylglucosamine transferase
LAIKAIARFSDCIAMTAAESKTFFRYHHNLVVSGYPTRPDMSGWTRQSARQHFGLSNDKPVLFIFGGSKGALSINKATFAILPSLLDLAQVLHVTGEAHIDEALLVREKLESPQDYHPCAYLHEDMGAAFTAANLAVCRAGASTLGELPLFGLPAIVVPYPYAWRYQKVNADYLVKNGGALLLKDESLNTDLLSSIKSLLQSPDRLTEMEGCLRSIAAPQAAQILANTLRGLVAEKKGVRS